MRRPRSVPDVLLASAQSKSEIGLLLLLLLGGNTAIAVVAWFLARLFID
jgi:hypothetical protein